MNYLRPLFSGGEARYVATALRVGRRSGVAETQAVGADGEVALSGASPLTPDITRR